MSIVIEKTHTHLIEGLDEDVKFELLEYLAEELGFDLAEQADPVDPQSDILDMVESAIRGLEGDVSVLKTQFAEGAEFEYAALDQVSENIESVISELLEAHANLNTLIDQEFDVDDEDVDDEDGDVAEDEE